MGVFETLAQTAASKAPIVESYSINKSFACDTVVTEGCMVKLKTDGAVTPVTAETDTPIGMVVVGNAAVDGKVTVQTNFAAIALGKAGASAITIADKLAAKSWNSTDKLTVYEAPAATECASAQALTGGASGATIVVGIYRAPHFVYAS